jgi:hypothetical protein
MTRAQIADPTGRTRAGRPPGADPPVHAVEPAQCGARPAQPDRLRRHRAARRARAGRTGGRPRAAAPRARCWWSGAARPGWRPPGTAALRGHRVRLVEREPVLGGALRLAAAVPGRARMGRRSPGGRASWTARRAGRARYRGGDRRLDRARAVRRAVVLATGSRAAPRRYPCDRPVLTRRVRGGGARHLHRGAVGAAPGTVVVHDRSATDRGRGRRAGRRRRARGRAGHPRPGRRHPAQRRRARPTPGWPGRRPARAAVAALRVCATASRPWSTSGPASGAQPTAPGDRLRPPAAGGRALAGPAAPVPGRRLRRAADRPRGRTGRAAGGCADRGAAGAGAGAAAQPAGVLRAPDQRRRRRAVRPTSTSPTTPPGRPAGPDW